MQLNTTQLKPLFTIWAEIMQQQKMTLIKLDSEAGDGDLGLSMCDGFIATNQAVSQATETDIGRLFYLAGKQMAQAAPSTLGTLMASGLMQVGKQFKGYQQLDVAQFGELFAAYLEGVQLRGKAKIGEKTFLDGLAPAVQSLQQPPTDSQSWSQWAEQAYGQAQQGVEQTTTMLAVHGRAATRGEASRSLRDPGAYVAELIMLGFWQFAQQHTA